MGTVDKRIADQIVAGEYKEDQPTRIVRYANCFGGFGYGVTFRDQDKENYLWETEYIRNPEIYWDPELGIDRSGEFDD